MRRRRRPAAPCQADELFRLPGRARGIREYWSRWRCAPATCKRPAWRASLWRPLKRASIGQPDFAEGHVRRAVFGAEALHGDVVAGFYGCGRPAAEAREHAEAAHFAFPISHFAVFVFQVGEDVGVVVDPLKFGDRAFHLDGVRSVKGGEPVMGEKRGRGGDEYERNKDNQFAQNEPFLHGSPSLAGGFEPSEGESSMRICPQNWFNGDVSR